MISSFVMGESSALLVLLFRMVIRCLLAVRYWLFLAIYVGLSVSKMNLYVPTIADEMPARQNGANHDVL